MPPRPGPRVGPRGAPHVGPNQSYGGGARTNPVAVHLETTGDQTDRTAVPYTTGSISLLGNEGLLAWIISSQTLITSAHPASIIGSAGAGISLDKIAEVTNFDSTSPARSCSLWRGRQVAGFTGTLAIDFGLEVMTGCGWSLVKFQQADLSGSNFAGAIAQLKTATSANAAVTTLPVTFDNALEFAGNLAICFAGIDTANVMAPQGGFTEIGEGGYANPGARVQASTLTGGTTTSPTWASSKAGAVLVEIKAG